MDELEDEFIDTFISELGIYLSINDEVETSRLRIDNNTLDILDKVASQL
jgi:hypothetical protein